MDQKMKILLRVQQTIIGILLMAASSMPMADGIGFDTTPNAFTFVDQVDVHAGMPASSAPVIISGINTATIITVSGGTYSVGCTGNWTSNGGVITDGQSVCVRHNTPLTGGTTTYTTLTVGGVSDTFASTTELIIIGPIDSDPDPFNFTHINGVMLGTPMTSAPVTLTGFNIMQAIRAENGELDIGCDGTIDVSNTNDQLYVEEGTSVCVHHISATSCRAAVTTTLHVGLASALFTTTTQECVNPSTDGGAFPPIAFLLLLLLPLLRHKSLKTALPKIKKYRREHEK